jgi:hypothetical protein
VGVTCLVLGIAVSVAGCSGPAGQVRSGPVQVVRISVSATTNWRSHELPSPPGATAASFNGISCASPGNCTAVGEAYFNTANSPQAIAVLETNGKWGPVTVLTMAGAPLSSAAGVSCTPDGACVAVGQIQQQGGRYAFAATEHHGRWAVTQVGTPGFAAAVTLNGVTCVSDGNCVAVGDASMAKGQAPMLATESGGTWRSLTAITPPNGVPQAGGGGDSEQLSSVACSQPGECLAVGDYLTEQDQSHQISRPMAVIESHGRWLHSVAVTVPPDAAAFQIPAGLGGPMYLGYAALESVSCVPRGPCLAVGEYSTAKVSRSGIAVSEMNGKWGPTQELPSLDAVTCNSEYCAALELPGTGNRDAPGIAITYMHGRWSQGTVIRPPANANVHAKLGDGLNLEGLACFPVSGCTAAGSYTDTSAHRDLLIATGP